MPSTAKLIVHESNDLKNVGLYEIIITEYYWHREYQNVFFTESVFVEIIDPCTLSTISSASSDFSFSVDTRTRKITAEWDPFEVKP